VLKAVLFHLAIQDAATEFCFAGQMHRSRDACAVGCHSLVSRVAAHHVKNHSRTCWRAASSEAFALYVIVVGCGRAPKTFPKRAHKRACSRLVICAHHVSQRAERIVHNASQACDAQPDCKSVFYHEAPGDRKLRRTLRAEAAAYARRSRPWRMLRSHDYQRASRKLSAHAVALCASCTPLYCPGAMRPRNACSRLTSRFRVAFYCRRVDLVCD